MNLLYKNRSEEDQAFIKYVCSDILSLNSKDKDKNETFAGIFIDGRNREINSLEDYTCFHSFYTFSEYAYPIYTFVHNTNNFLNNNQELIDKYNIKIIQIDKINSSDEVSIFSIQKLFFMLPNNIENIINLQPDAMLMKSGYEEYLSKHNFTYIGPPWLHAPGIEFLGKDNTWKPFFNQVRIGNGALSYRKASFCRAASKAFGHLTLREKFAENNKIPPEDLFYSVIANATQGNMPTIEQARMFSIDPLDKIDYNNKTSYGFHYFSAINPWKR
jgi:hypothetical protein